MHFLFVLSVSSSSPSPTMRWLVLVLCLLALVQDMYVPKLVLIEVLESYIDSIQQLAHPLGLESCLFGGGNLGFFVSTQILEHIQARKRQESEYICGNLRHMLRGQNIYTCTDRIVKRWIAFRLEAIRIAWWMIISSKHSIMLTRCCFDSSLGVRANICLH